MEKVKWYIKQILPMRYYSKYKENGSEYLSVWKMWFGKIYKHRKFEIKKEILP